MKQYVLTVIIFSAFVLSLSCQAKINIIGVSDEVEKNIRLFLGVDSLECKDVINTIYADSLIKKSQKAVEPFGYYHANMVLKPHFSDGRCAYVDLMVDIGPAITIRKLDFVVLGQKSSDNEFEKIILNSQLIKNQRLQHAHYEDLKSELIEYASEHGYLDAHFTKSSVDVFRDEHVADVSLYFDTGKRFQVANVEILQDPVFLDRDFIRKMINLNSGDYFSNERLNSIRKKLLATGYFKQVSVEVLESKRNKTKVPINVVLTAGDRIKYAVGLGFSTDIGPRVSVDYNNHRISGFGYQFNSKLNLSDTVSDFVAGIKIPSKHKPINKWSNIDMGYRVERNNSVNSDTAKLGFSKTRVHHNKWQNINYIDYINEKFESADTNNESKLLVPGTNWSYIQTDDPTHPTLGMKAQIDLKGSSSGFLSDVSFVQLSLGFKGIIGFGEGRNRLIVKTDLATTYTNNFDQLPTSYRFYAGGDRSLRGFDFQELGPRMSGAVIGGKHLATASFEVERRIKGPWAAAIFVDMGNAFTDSFTLEKSFGFGARWFSPIGPFRFDVGFPVKNERDFKVHITLGPDL